MLALCKGCFFENLSISVVLEMKHTYIVIYIAVAARNRSQSGLHCARGCTHSMRESTYTEKLMS